MVYDIYDPSGNFIIKRFKHDMMYAGGFMTNDDATYVAAQFKERGHKTFVFSPRTSHGVKGYPFNLWVSRYPVKGRRLKQQN
jgi:hypothetical protein